MASVSLFLQEQLYNYAAFFSTAIVVSFQLVAAVLPISSVYFVTKY